MEGRGRGRGRIYHQFNPKTRSDGTQSRYNRGSQARSQSAVRRGRGAFANSSRWQSLNQLDTGDDQENRSRYHSNGTRGHATFRQPEGVTKRESLRGRIDGNYADRQDRSHKKYIGYQKLKSWAAETNPGELVLWIANESDALTDLLQKMDLKPDWYSLLLKICRQILLATHQKQALKKILTILVSSHFLGQSLFRFVTEKRRRSWPDADEFFDDILAILKEIIHLLPQYAVKCQMALSLLPDMVNQTREISDKEYLLKTFHDLQEDINKIELESKAGPRSMRKAVPYRDSDTPPEDFRVLSVIPDASDLQVDAEPFVRAVLSKGAYRDEAHYLDVQFRLMREDFIQPLRVGISEFKKSGCRKDFKPSDLRLYFNVQIIGMTTLNGINHVLQFDNKSLRSIKWEHSKRFLNGSLLCLSKDNFETVYFATVAYRNPDDLKEGIITVEFRTGLEAVFSSPSSDVFVMAETTAYFEAYNPVLEGLQELDSSSSLQRYIIFCKEILKPPAYLLGSIVKYDLSSLSPTMSGDFSAVPVLNTMSWPQVSTMSLNESQREAVQLALTKELAIIQGPPGTGKTYVGLKVMRVLLKNQDVLAGSGKNCGGPILVLCFTNHALDQFLEGVVEFCPKGVVRVGGRSSSPIMENLNLKNLTRKHEMPISVKRALWNSKMEMETISHKIEKLKLKIDSLSINVEKESVLEQFILPQHFYELMCQSDDGFSGGKGSQIKHWLNASKSLSRDTLPLMIKSHMTSLILQVGKVLFFDDNIPNDQLKKTLQSMHVVDRACIYQGWLQAFLSGLDMRIYQNRFMLEEVKGRILSDLEIGHVIHPRIFNCLFAFNQATDLGVIEGWILRLDRNLSDQLDDIESLIHFSGQHGNNSDEEIDDVDGNVQSQNDRLIDSDNKEGKEIAKATKRIKDGDAYLLMKAEKLGIGKDTEDQKDEGEWQTVTRKKPLSFSKIRHCLKNIQPMTEEEEADVDSLWTLDLKKRFALYNRWTHKYRDEIAEKMEELVDNYQEALKGKMEIRAEVDVDFLRRARVIGMTTTGAAKYRAKLQAVSCPIIVVEEAAEVLEAHIITALNKNCKHLILIGDHQQLKPNPTVYTLAKDYHLDLSLFERLINNGIQHVTLKEQHRMRTSISKVVRHIYPSLQDHISVTKYENVRGMEKNIFFINHEKRESDVNDAKSKSNAHEASYLVALLNHFLLQGYEPSQISILATYVGQIFMLRKELKAKHLGDGVRVTTVDNYQGEENDIILLSLVRSNAQSNAGFLKVDNRVCVALSRAKKGFYAIGNFNMLASQSKLWTRITETAKLDGILGEGLPVTCPNHTSFRIEIASPEDFAKKCPQGGCGRPCEIRLKCGHACPFQCHGYDPKHEKVKCSKKCIKTCPQGHPCLKKCFQECGKCVKMVDKNIPRCQHMDKVPCYMPAQNAVCSQPCPEYLDCQHQCSGKCGECHENKQHKKCQIPVEYFWPCDHICKVPCYKKPSEYSCPKKCEDILACGHACKGTCSECVNGMMHVACKKECSKVLPCGHQCKSSCGVPCPPCILTCSDSCQHSACYKEGHACGGKCNPCQESCLYRCTHQKCSKNCSEDCDIEPCHQICKKTLKCQHPCSGLCGEICVCALCDKINKLTQSSQEGCENSEQNKASSTDDEQKGAENSSKESEQTALGLLIKLPSCYHVFYVQELDSYVESLQADVHVFVLPCPVCKENIQKCFRYNKIIKAKYHAREKEKEKIRKLTEVSSNQKAELTKSLKLLKSVDLNDTWVTITKVEPDKLKTGHEAMSLNCKCKYAHVLSDLQVLANGITSLDSDIALKIKAVQKLTTNITQQQKSEFRYELKYTLLSIYIKKLVDTWQLSLKENSKLFQEAKSVLKEEKNNRSIMKNLIVIANSLKETLKEKDAFTLSLTHANKTVVRDIEILDSRTDETLYEILKPKPQPRRSDVLSRLKGLFSSKNGETSI